MNHAPRRFDRSELQLPARLKRGDTEYACRIVNISAGGARLRLESESQLEEGDDIALELDGLGQFPAKTVWRRDWVLGIEFGGDPETMAEVVMGLAMYSSG